MSDISDLTVLLLRVGFLVLLWVFIFIVIYSLRSDLFGSRITRLQQQGSTAPAPTAPPAATPSPRATPTPAANPDAATTVTDMSRGSRRSAPAAAAPASRLVVTGGPRAGLEMDLPATGLTIGRSSGSGLQVKDDYSSSNHARLVLSGTEWRIEDLGSTNGTFVGGRRISGSTSVTTGVELRIGTTTFELRR